MNSLWRMIIRDMEGCFSPSLQCGVEAHSTLKWEAVLFCLQTGAAGLNAAATSLIRQLNLSKDSETEPPFFKTREKSHFSLWRFAPARIIYKKFDLQQTTATAETPTFGLMLSGIRLNLQSAEDRHRQKDWSERYWINYKYVKYNIYCSFIVVDTFMLKNILKLLKRSTCV